MLTLKFEFKKQKKWVHLILRQDVDKAMDTSCWTVQGTFKLSYFLLNILAGCMPGNQVQEPATFAQLCCRKRRFLFCSMKNEFDWHACSDIVITVLLNPVYFKQVGMTHYFSFLKSMAATISYWQERKRKTFNSKIKDNMHGSMLWLEWFHCSVQLTCQTLLSYIAWTSPTMPGPPLFSFIIYSGSLLSYLLCVRVCSSQRKSANWQKHN